MALRATVIDRDALAGLLIFPNFVIALSLAMKLPTGFRQKLFYLSSVTHLISIDADLGQAIAFSQGNANAFGQVASRAGHIFRNRYGASESMIEIIGFKGHPGDARHLLRHGDNYASLCIPSTPQLI
jgi:hypothetical protein